MNKVIKITMILFIIIIYVFGSLNTVNAWTTSSGSSGGGSESIAEEIDIEKHRPDYVEDSDTFKERVGIVLSAIRSLGIIISVIALMIIGIKTMTASVEEKSVYKEALPGYIIGLIMVVAITTLPSIIYDIASGLND